jgi:lysophospholipase L1-like esterase
MIAVAAVLLGFVASAQAQAGPERWELAIAAFEAADKAEPAPRDGIVFVGSSSIRLWDVKKAFPDLPCVNRGFGGSHMGDSAYFAERIVIPYKPRIVVVFAGGNDIAAGKSPEQVCQDFQELVGKIHAALPKTKIYFVSLFPTVARWKLDDNMRRANELIEAFTKSNARLGYIDTRTKMTAEGGGPRPELLRADNLHMNDKGYTIWNEIVGPILRAEYKEADAAGKTSAIPIPCRARPGMPFAGCRHYPPISSASFPHAAWPTACACV